MVYISKQKLARVPEEVAVILPIRFPKTLAIKCNTKLKNDFSVTILDVPVEENNFSKIKKRCNLLRSSADPLVRHFMFLINLFLMRCNRKYLGAYVYS